MLKKFLFGIIFFVLSLSIVPSVFAQEQTTLYFFWGQGCPHCAKEKAFLEIIKDKYPNLTIRDFEIYNSNENQELFVKAAKELSISANGVPFTVVGEKTFTGYFNDEITGNEIENQITSCLENGCPDKLMTVVTEQKTTITPSQQQKEKQIKKATEKQQWNINVPIIGEISLKNLSLPVITLIIAALDGFNPCAMWTLLFLLSLLLGMEDRKRMWILGIAFIIASASVYFLFMAAWLNVLLFIGFIFWVKLFIAAVAFIGGGYNLKEFFTNKYSSCNVTNNQERQKVFAALRTLTHEKNFWIALGGIILLAGAVNLVELVCSAGLPAIYVQILSLNHLPSWQYYLYLAFYIFIFMLDDLIVFFVTMKTLEVTGITTKYSRASHLIGGILMILIGFLLLFKPEWLLFG